MAHSQLITMFTKIPILTLAIAIYIWWYLWSVVLLLLCQALEYPEQPVQVALIAGMDAHSQSPPCYAGGAKRKSTYPPKLLAHYYTAHQGLTMTLSRNTRHTGAPALKETISINKIHERSELVMATQAWNKQPPQVRAIKKLEHYKQFLKKNK